MSAAWADRMLLAGVVASGVMVARAAGAAGEGPTVVRGLTRAVATGRALLGV